MSINKESVINEWVRMYTKDLLNWCNFRINDMAQSEDIVQDTFISAFENFETFKGDSNVRTWLYRILNNKIIDHYRKKGRIEFVRESIDLNDAEKATENFFDKNGAWKKDLFNDNWGKTDNLLDDLEFRDVLMSCLEDLPTIWKSATLSKYILNRKSDEICQDLNITPSNYWQIVHRSKLLLKLCLENNWFKK